MFRLFVLLSLLAPVLSVPSRTLAQSEDPAVQAAQQDVSPPEIMHETDLVVSGAYAYATTDVQKNGAAFFTVSNRTGSDDKLLNAQSDIAETVEVHTHLKDGAIMKMRKVESIDVPMGNTIGFAPMGNHIMFMGLKSPLEAGTSFPLTLTFEKKGDVEVEVHVRDRSGTGQVSHTTSDEHKNTTENPHVHHSHHDHGENEEGQPHHHHGHADSGDRQDKPKGLLGKLKFW